MESPVDRRYMKTASVSIYQDCMEVCTSTHTHAYTCSNLYRSAYVAVRGTVQGGEVPDGIALAVEAHRN